MTDRYREKWKKGIACILAVLLIVQPVLTEHGIQAGVETVLASMSGGEGVTIYNRYLGGGSDGTGNLLKKGTRITDFYGRDIRTGIWYYGDNTKTPLACINPARHQRNGTPAKKYVIDFEELASGAVDTSGFGTAFPLTLEQLETIYYAAQELGLTPDKFGSNGMGRARFIVYQSLVWAVVSGKWTTVDEFVDQIHRVTRWVADTSMKNDIEAIVHHYADTVRLMTAPEALPEWGYKYKALAEKNPQKLTEQEDGTWSAVLPIDGSNWEHKELVFGSENETALPEGWSVFYGDEEITFSYSGTEKPDGVVLCGRYLSGAAAEYMLSPSTIEIVIPDNGINQPMIGMAGNPNPWQVYVAFGAAPGKIIDNPEVEFEIFNHDETFVSDYNIQIEKRDSETGKELEHAEFNIYEAFDRTQLNGTVLVGTNKAGTEGISQFSSPFEKCTPELTLIDEKHRRRKTDQEGCITHKDTFEYRYQRTYCGGHPEPKPVEIGEAATEEEAEAAEEANESARRAWEAGIQWCEANTDFHSVEPGEAMTACKEERDQAYEEFTKLKFQFAVKEVKAREGYILHNHHNDDKKIEIIEVESNQAGGEKTVIGYLNRDFDKSSESLGMNLKENTDGQQEQKQDRTVSENDPVKPNVSEDSRYQYYRLYRNPFLLLSRFASASEAKNTASGSEALNSATDSDADDTWRSRFDSHLSPNSVLTSTGEKDERSLGNSETDGSGEVGFTLNGPFPSTIEPVRQNDYDRETILHTFKVCDHRTEGELHINKRDMEIDEKNPNESFGLTQGDGVLEGAVYGLYAAENIIHPDGRTGIIFHENELVSVATTDKNGEASFLVITEPPKRGQAIDGKPWIGRPLILGKYYIKEIARSEGYELSVAGGNQADTNHGGIPVVIKRTGAASTTGLYFDDNETESHAKFDVTHSGTPYGYDIYVSNYPEGTKFYRYISTDKSAGEKVLDHYEEIKTPKKAVGGEIKNDREGRPLYKKGSSGELIYDTKAPKKMELNYGEWKKRPSYVPNTSVDVTQMPSFSMLNYMETTEEDTKEILKSLMNELLEARGYHSMDAAEQEGGGWKLLGFSGKTHKSMVEELADWCDQNTFWDTLVIDSIFQAGGRWFVKMYADYKLLPGVKALVNPYDDILYVKGGFTDSKGKTRCYWQEYPAGTYVKEKTKRISLSPMRGIREAVPVDGRIEEYEVNLYEPVVERYFPGEQMYYYFPDGEAEFITEYKPVYREQIVINQEWTLEEQKKVARSAETGVYTIHVECEADDEPTGVSTDTFLAVTPESTIVLEGKTMDYGAYLAYFGNGGVFPSPTRQAEAADSFIKDVVLYYPGQFRTFSDGGTRENPKVLRERAIRQTIKVIKKIDRDSYEGINTYAAVHEDWFTRVFGGFFKNGTGTGKMDNFRFKAYLKSNLERLYRDEEGFVVWQDRKGNEIDIAKVKEKFPVSSMGIYTKAYHIAEPLFKDSNDAVVSNDTLYGSPNGNIMDGSPHTRSEGRIDEQNSGYTRILETMNEDTGSGKDSRHYNYDKFFDGIETANCDKWVDGSPSYTSGRPVGNGANHGTEAVENNRGSDAVRQFAIRWYFRDEIKKMVTGYPQNPEEGEEAFQNEIYDIALNRAIEKAVNYLKPFFLYDLDSIYSVDWDGSPDGGTDHTAITLSADISEGGEDGYCYGISGYLPYGTYVITEQQPKESVSGDFKNRNYRMDSPREITIPTVYAGHDEVFSGGRKNEDYTYVPDMSPEEMQEKYFIRFLEEDHVIKAHNHDGDFEVYKYGMEPDKIQNGAVKDHDTGYFALTQSEFRPFKNYYNSHDDRRIGEVPYYLSEGMSGREPVSRYYRYSSVSEQRRGDTMQGSLIAVKGQYAPMLVPWSVKIPDQEEADGGTGAEGESLYQGYAYVQFDNDFYETRLRIEKLDTDTGENILHDGAIFAIYAAEREAEEDSLGRAKFYEKDTLINGSKEFLEAMGAENITSAAREKPGIGQLWTGIVPAGTPVCQEEEQIILTDHTGNRTGLFEAFTTTRDGPQAGEENPEEMSCQDQNTGYLETPEPLGAGVYVLCEINPPAGYARCRPTAIEIYSDRITYYLNGGRDKRTAAAVYEYSSESGTTESVHKTVAGLYVGNTPARLEVSKLGENPGSVTYQTGTRLEGSENELKQRYGAGNLEFAYKNGTYLGYAWRKGTLEYLEARKALGEAVTPVYENGIFSGYGNVTIPRQLTDNKKPYAAGARMTLYDAIPIKKNGRGGDFDYDGVSVIRDSKGNVQSIRVLSEYAGSFVRFVNKEDVAGSLEGKTGNGSWTYETIPRGDTDILYYSLGELKVTERGRDGNVYGFDRVGSRVNVKGRNSIFVMKNGKPEFEIMGSGLEEITYSSMDKCFAGVRDGTVIYHLDTKGNRDSMTDPETGMAYIEEGNRIFVWPVKVAVTKNGAVIAREKIQTYRIASVNAGTDQEYTIGTYDGQNLARKMRPVIDENGRPVYYQRSEYGYKKGEPVYDIDHDYVRYRFSDLLMPYNLNSYQVNPQQELLDIGEEENVSDDRKLYHRQGEAWIMENTWVTGDETPDDPFRENITEGKADILKRVIPGTYIMEEISAPAGFVRAFPSAVTVEEDADIQKAEVTDEKIKVEVAKVDGPDQYKIDIISDYEPAVTTIESKGTYTYQSIPGVQLALYRAKRVYTFDSDQYPKGYYLIKTGDKPIEWITTETPKYLEEIPAGDYILEEIKAASGYIRTSMEIEIKATGEVQGFELKNDHTKLEIYKYYKDESGHITPLPNENAAVLSLYAAMTDSEGNIVMDEGEPQYDQERLIETWKTDDLSEYTRLTERSRRLGDRIRSFLGLKKNQSSFITDYEDKYRKEGTKFSKITWLTKDGERNARLQSCVQMGKTDSVVQLWRTDTGKDIRITIYRNVLNGTLDSDGKLPLIFEYQFNYRELEWGMKSYDTIQGLHRIDYLPFTSEKAGKRIGNYVLVETTVPDGYEAAAPKAVIIDENGSIQRFGLENTEKYIEIIKIAEAEGKLYSMEGVKLALYRAADDGGFIDDETQQVETWISGGDGRYTKEEERSGKIPAGLSAGDFKPHRINRMPYGIYYVVEEEVPDYMIKSEPLRIEIGAETAKLYQVVNKPAFGRLVIKKVGDDTGLPLPNARFKVKNRENGQEWYLTTDQKGQAVLENLPVGRFDRNGGVIPYSYTIEESAPPECYQITGGVRQFQFDGKSGQPLITYQCEITDKPTEIHFNKTDFDTGILVEGAKIAIYPGRVVDGSFEKTGEAVQSLVTGKNGFTIVKKLSANRTYILEEEEAPPGYVKANPVIFTINRKGTGISSVSGDFCTMKAAYNENAVETLTITGRVVTGVSVILRDLDSNGFSMSFLGDDADHILTAKDGLVSGHLYEISEYTQYSDGNENMTDKITKRIYFDEQGKYHLKLRAGLWTEERLVDQRGKLVEEWRVEQDKHDHTIINPVLQEPVIATIAGSSGADDSAVRNGDVIKYVITYSNPYDIPVSIKIKAVLSEGLEYMRSDGNGKEENDTITWDMENVDPHKSGTAELVAAVTGEEGGMTKALFLVKAGETEKRNTLTNPIVPAGSVTVRNRLSGTGKDVEDRFTYRITFRDQNGVVLKGYQPYIGSVEGRLKGEGSIILSGEEYAIFCGLPYGTQYDVTQEPLEGYTLEECTRKGSVTEEQASTVFENKRDDESLREILIKNENYKLEEITHYSTGEDITGGIYRFRLNERGQIDNIDMEERLVSLYFSKVDIDTEEELDGGQYSLEDAESGTVIYQFTKEDRNKTMIPSEILQPGKTYIFREILPPSGYAWSEEVEFTVNKDGIPEIVMMQDHRTDVRLAKIDAETGKPLTGGHFTIRDAESRDSVYEFTANGREVLLEGILEAGKTYEFVEDIPPAGYIQAKSVIFTVPKEPKPVYIVMEDRPTEVVIKKLIEGLESDTGTDRESYKEFKELEQGRIQLQGFVLQILNLDGSPAKAIQEGGGFLAGKNLIFTVGEGQGEEIQMFRLLKGQLEAGKGYLLHEVKPRPGYACADDIPFTVGMDEYGCEIIMIDRPTHVTVTKKDLTGGEELPGNGLSIRTEDGEVVDSWISGTKPHEIIGKLEAGRKYYLHETCPVSGYAYAKDVEFTVNTDGSTDVVVMENEMTKVRIRKLTESGATLKGAVMQILDGEKNVVVDDFVTEEDPVEVCGILAAGQTYYLHEVKAPTGYLMAADVPFTVPESAEVTEVVMIDEKRPEGGSEVKSMFLKKTDAKTGLGIEGVEFTIWSEDGSTYLTVDTGKNGYAKFEMPEDGMYSYKETKIAAGYLQSEETYYFTIDAGRVTESSTVIVANQPIPEETPRIGTITAVYEKKESGVKGAVYKRRRKGEKTGDENRSGLAVLILLLSLMGLVIGSRKKKNVMNEKENM